MKRTIGFIAVLAFIAIIVWSPKQASSAPTEQAVDQSAKLSARTSENCVTNAAGGTLVPTTGFTNRKAIELQNLGPNAIFCTVYQSGGTVVNPLSTGALGRRVDSGGGTWSLDVGRGVVVRCIAATAAQVTPACTQLTELR